jgi:hypothetical protein
MRRSLRRRDFAIVLVTLHRLAMHIKTTLHETFDVSFNPNAFPAIMSNTLTAAAKAVPPPFELPEFKAPLGDTRELSRINVPIKLNIRLSADAQRWFGRNSRPFKSLLPPHRDDPKLMNTYFLTNGVPNVRNAHPWYPVIPLELGLGSLRVSIGDSVFTVLDLLIHFVLARSQPHMTSGS